MISASDLNKITRQLATRVLLHIMNKKLGVQKLGEMRDALFHAACQALALVLVKNLVDPVVTSWSTSVRAFVFLCFLLQIVYRIATSKRRKVTFSLS